MKKKFWRILLILIFSIILTSIISPNSLTLAKEKSAEEELEDSVDEKLDELNTDELDKFFNSLTDEEREAIGKGGIKQLIKDIANGKYNGDSKQLIDRVLSLVYHNILGFLPSLISIIVISILLGMLSGLSSGFLNKSTNDIIYFVCYGAIIIILLNSIINFVNLTTDTVAKIKNLIEVIFPILLTLMTALGGATSVGLYQPLILILSTVIIKTISVIIIPCFIASIIFAIVGNISKTVKLEKFTKFFKSVSEWILGIMFSLFMLFVTTKGIAGITVDGIGINATKFAISSYVPILGGYISDGFDLVLASCIIIKNSVGVAGLLILLAIVLSPIIKISVYILGLKFAAAVCEPLGDNKISDLLNTISKNMMLLISAMMGIAFLYFIVVMLIVFTCNLGVI